jgi:hypothetical protein
MRRTRKGFGALLFLAEWTGLEPATPGVTGRYSNQLNYHSAWDELSTVFRQYPSSSNSPASRREFGVP